MFHRNRRRPDGRQGRCADCARVWREAAKTADPRGVWAKETVRGKRSLCKRKGLPFALTVDYLLSIAPDVCPVFNVPLTYGLSGHTGADPHSPSVDRVDGPLGYVPGNLIIVSNLANVVRHTATPTQILRVGEFYARLLATPILTPPE